MTSKFIFKLINHLRVCWYYKLEMKYIQSLFAFCGQNVVVSNECIIAGHNNISIGNNTYIGPRCLMYSTEAKLLIGDDVTIGPQVSIVTGDHRFDVIGKLIRENTEKLPENDQDVIIENDCWIGMNVNILKGVTIGKGSIVAAGATVIKDIPPYSIYVSKDNVYRRFSDEQMVEHERLLAGGNQ
ncbi:MAG: acyltransferase [Clostridia bacterium]|nr:acyltransferase [Clostridia bacterium]